MEKESLQVAHGKSSFLNTYELAGLVVLAEF